MRKKSSHNQAKTNSRGTWTSQDSSTGAENTGRFAGKGKTTCCKEFEDENESSLRALSNLGTQEKPDEETMKGIEELICQLYQSKNAINTVEELRWSLFKKRQAESDKLPPNNTALHQAILRAHYELMGWNNDYVTNPVLPFPEIMVGQWKMTTGSQS